MALITCGECGRAVSNKAAACIGCGAPIGDLPGVNLVPKRSAPAPLSTKQIKRRAVLFLSMFVVGVVWASLAEHGQEHRRLWVFIAALLIIGGLSGLLVALTQSFTRRT